MTGAAPGVQKTWERSAPVWEAFFFFLKARKLRVGFFLFCFSHIIFLSLPLSALFSPPYPQRRHRREEGRPRVLAATPDDGDAPGLALAARPCFVFRFFFF